MTYRLIALDVDGTLINDDHHLTPRVRAAVRAVSEHAEIVLCTGRGSLSALTVLNELGLDGTMITHNGASIVDSRSREVLVQRAIDPLSAKRYIDYCRDNGIHFDMNTPFDLYVEELSEVTTQMYERMYARPIIRGREDALPASLVKLSIFAPAETLDRTQEVWGGWHNDLQVVRSGDYFIDVQHPLASKGAALAHLAELRGISREETLAIGNYYNDMGMIDFAGWGVAMANSPAALLEAADEVTLSNNEDGVAKVLEERILAYL